MAFDKQNYGRTSTTYNSNSPILFTYTGGADNKATIQAADYFVELVNELKVGDFIFIEASDGPTAVTVNLVDKVTPSVTVIVFIA